MKKISLAFIAILLTMSICKQTIANTLTIINNLSQPINAWLYEQSYIPTLGGSFGYSIQANGGSTLLNTTNYPPFITAITFVFPGESFSQRKVANFNPIGSPYPTMTTTNDSYTLTISNNPGNSGYLGTIVKDSNPSTEQNIQFTGAN